MKRSEFLKKTGAVSLGIGAMAVIPTTSVEGGVNDNTSYEKLLGHKSITNVGDGTVTGAIGNEALQTNAQNLSGAVNELKKSVSDGKKLLADTITGKGVQTASDATFETIANNIGTLADNLSSASTDSYNRGYSQGVTDADNRANPSSTNYKTGYNAGVSAVQQQTTATSYNGNTGNSTATYTYNIPLQAGTYLLTCVGVSNQNGGYATEPAIALDGHNTVGAVLIMNDVKSKGDMQYGSIAVKTQTYKVWTNGGTLTISITPYSGNWVGNAQCATYQLTKISNNVF